ncbi:type VI secretion system-associated FHA domain protein TagH [Novosphingobium sp.]|jgi:type VI secretion system FHA domain protein|uniref:type VI secretion system-associated FHA domain protein TagH n=1 Tax=Novosphingobium sp. TaxID=1874826 RepID=UPI002FDF6F45
MILRLSILNAGSATLDNGTPVEFCLDRRGALIGRSPSCDWSLPDARNHISSRHCEIRFQDARYVLSDISMNGTFLNDRPDRLIQPQALNDGDLLTIGHYRIRVGLSQGFAAPLAGAGTGTTSHAGGHDAGHSPAPAPAPSGWDAWGAPTPPSPPFSSGLSEPPLPSAPAPASNWGAPSENPGAGWEPAPSPSLGWGAPPAFAGSPSNASHGQSDAWGSVPVAPPASGNDGWAPAIGTGSGSAMPVSSAWASAEAPQQSASGWSSAAPDRPPAPAPDDIWGRLAEGNVVDWARGGFGQPIDEQPDPLGLNPQPKDVLGVAPANPFDRSTPWSDVPPRPAGAPISDIHFAMPPAQGNAPLPADSARAAPQAPVPPATPAPDALLEAFLRAAGVETSVTQRNPALLERAGKMFHRLVAGLVVMVEARARAKSQMGAQSTAFEVDGNNPIKFSRTPEDAITALLNPPARGFLDAGPAIEEAFFDLQSHQLATLRAMQGALRTTLDRFSPGAIRKRAESRGLLARILPTARDAALWQAYEKEFGGVAQGSDEAFMDMFAKEFRRAYEEQLRERTPHR